MPNKYINPYRDTAHQYHLKGWTPRPLNPKSKSPPTVEYPDGSEIPLHGADRILPTADDITAWVHRYGRGNIGIVPPPGIVGIDLDLYKGNAEILWYEYAEQHEFDPESRFGAPMSSARTCGAGILWFRWPEDEQLPPRKLPFGEMIMSHHGYAVAPPSYHPDTNTQYKWFIDGREQDQFYIPDIKDLPDIPQPVLAVLQQIIDERTKQKSDKPSATAKKRSLGHNVFRDVVAAFSASNSWESIIPGLVKNGTAGHKTWSERYDWPHIHQGASRKDPGQAAAKVNPANDRIMFMSSCLADYLGLESWNGVDSMTYEKLDVAYASGYGALPSARQAPSLEERVEALTTLGLWPPETTRTMEAWKDSQVSTVRERLS